MSLELLPDGESLLVLDLRFEAKGAPVTFGKTPFGLVGVRLARLNVETSLRRFIDENRDAEQRRDHQEHALDDVAKHR